MPFKSWKTLTGKKLEHEEEKKKLKKQKAKKKRKGSLFSVFPFAIYHSSKLFPSEIHPFFQI